MRSQAQNAQYDDEGDDEPIDLPEEDPGAESDEVEASGPHLVDDADADVPAVLGRPKAEFPDEKSAGESGPNGTHFKIAYDQANWCARQVLPPEEAEDATHNFMIRYLAAYVDGSLPPELVKPSAYLKYAFRSMQNQLLDLGRALAAAPEQVPLNDEVHAAASGADPELEAIRSDIREIVAKTLAGMPPMRAAVFKSRALRGLPEKETATTLRTSVANVRYHLNAAHQDLREALKDYKPTRRSK